MEEIPQETARKLVEKLERRAARHAELERMMADHELISDTARYAQVRKEYGPLTRFAQLERDLSAARARRQEAEELLGEGGQDAEMQELAQEEMAVGAAEEQRVLSEAERNVIMEIRGGTGGEEAALFAGDLMRMYQRFCQAKGWKMELLDSSPTDKGGFRDVTVSISGKGAWPKLRCESGGHRVQRVPVTESQGRIHTSLATVAVLPEAEDVDVELKPEDLEVSFMRSQGPGGQNVNKVSSCVRLVHKPTGVIVKCQQEKSQHKNRKLAEKILRARLYELQQQESKQKRDALRRSQVGSGDRNERVRTYNFPQDRITDHRIGLDVFGIEAVLMGECDKIFDALARWDRQARIQEFLEE